MAKPPISILVVDDFEPFRRSVRSTLENEIELHTLVEASDGVEAVEQAQYLQPDLILLDIGLPKVNGLEAARRIRALAPRSKILFLSQESSVDVVQAAFSAGASGYVVKIDAGSELPTAVKAVLRGEKFVSSRFTGHSFTGLTDAPNSGSDPGNKGFRLLQGQDAEIVCHHEVGFYSDDRFFLDDVTHFVGAALKAGNAAIVVATEPHRDSLLPRLRAFGVDIVSVVEKGKYISLDATDTLSTFMLNGRPDPVRFLKLFGNLIAKTAEAVQGEQTRVAIFGECVHLLWAQGNVEAAIQVEELGNQLVKTNDVDILCGYSLGSAQGGMAPHTFQRICAAHSAVRTR